MNTSDRRWAKIRDLFQQAMDLPAAERDAFLERECEGDARLKKELQRLLRSDAQGGVHNPLTQAVGVAMHNTAKDRRRDLVGTVVGPYKLVSVLGHGGVGTVYLGERIDRQYSAQVAVKVVESATLHSEILERFRAERQILARLNHPHIGRLLDAGETGAGVPYLVMEYIHGEPIDRYCNNNKLTIEARLRLFLKVCEAVQFAHQNLIVHRDLKPGNILVTADGTPKLLDFGIAKLLDTSDAIAALALTRVNDRVLTPEYASPEQILGKAITTSSDVYSLGVVLYELLAGIRPYAISATSQLELERSICITDPPKPSATVKFDGRSTDNKGPTQRAAEARATIPSRLRKQLAGDIDAIVLRALRKEPERRYSSIEQFAADVQRHLQRQPVAARQGNWLYYSQRFLGRHAFGVTISILGIAGLSAFAISTSIQSNRIAAERDRATQEQRRAETVSNFMLDVFAAADPFIAQGHEITARELLDKAAAKINRELTKQPEVHVRLVEAIGFAYENQGQPDRAVIYLQDALRLRHQMGNNDARTFDILINLAISLRELGNFSDSAKTFEEAMDNLKLRHKQESTEYANLLKNIGRLEHARGQIEEARRHFQEGMVLSKKLYGSNHPEVAAFLWNLANLALWQQELGAAEQYSRQAVDIYHLTLPETHPDRINADSLLGQVLLAEGKTEEAGLTLEHAVAAQKNVFGPRSAQVLNTMTTLSDVRIAQGRYQEAELLLREVLERTAELYGNQHYEVGVTRTYLSDALRLRGKPREATDEAKLALDILRSKLPADHQYIASAEYQYGLSLLAAGKAGEARKQLENSIYHWERSGAPAWRAARSESALGEALSKIGKNNDAKHHLMHSFDILEHDLGSKNPTTQMARARLNLQNGAHLPDNKPEK